VKKISPKIVKDDYAKKLGNLVQFYDAGFASFSEGDQSTFTEHSLLAAAVIWEGFVSDLFIAYINRDASKFTTHLKASFDEHLKLAGTPQRVFSTFGEIKFPAHLTKAQTYSLADNGGNNITFSNFRSLEEKAKSWLSSTHAGKFSNLTGQQKAVIDSVIALRNHIAHRSKRSLDAMNEALNNGALHTTGIKRGPNRFHNVGAWLKAKPVGRQDSRFWLIMLSLTQIGAAV
jgi:hypothetical protein